MAGRPHAAFTHLHALDVKLDFQKSRAALTDSAVANTRLLLQQLKLQAKVQVLRAPACTHLWPESSCMVAMSIALTGGLSGLLLYAALPCAVEWSTMLRYSASVAERREVCTRVWSWQCCSRVFSSQYCTNKCTKGTNQHMLLWTTHAYIADKTHSTFLTSICLPCCHSRRQEPGACIKHVTVCGAPDVAHKEDSTTKRPEAKETPCYWRSSRVNSPPKQHPHCTGASNRASTSRAPAA